MRVVLFLFIVLLLQSCVVDPTKARVESASESLGEHKQKVIEADNGRMVIIDEQDSNELEELRKKFQQPKIQELTIDIGIPMKEDWYLVKEQTIQGFSPVGVASYLTNVYLTDTIQNLVLQVDIESGDITELTNSLKVTYINQRSSKLLMPMFDLDSIFVYRGGAFLDDMFKFDIPYELNHPTCFDGLRINDFTIVDQGKHRLIYSKKGEFSTRGSYGSGKDGFDTPTAVVWANNKIYVTDTGNSRVQLLDNEGLFVSSFGTKDGMMRPTGVASDGKHVFVCDEGLKAILVYLPNGKLAYKLDHMSKAPSDVYFGEGKLYIADKEGTTLKILANKIYNS